MEKLWNGTIRIELPIISCEGMEFYSLLDAANHFKCSDERIRQKLKSDKYLDFIYID
jgi:hypothetical protein